MLPASFRNRSARHVLEGFGRAQVAACRYVAPRSIDELARALTEISREGLTATFRGTGNSYGDASLNHAGVVVDTSRLRSVLAWDAETGIIDVEPGVTIEDLWRHTLQDGYWPYVVPGTMKPTLAGCLAANIHGKNNFVAGPIGEHVLEFELLVPTGETLQCSREKNPDIFYAAIGGMGLLGAMTRIRLRLKRVASGRLRVQPIMGRNLDEMFDKFRQHLSDSDYLVGWVDCLAAGSSLGRGEIHAAYHLKPGEDPDALDSLRPEQQDLPPRLFGFPMSRLWQVMRLFTNNWGVRLTNTAKYYSARLSANRAYLQSHVAFAFLLDYVPNWRLAYGPGGLIQYQIFVPDGTARDCFRDILKLGQEAGLPSYLGVLKRHRPDRFLLSHAVDGWSLALDFRVTRSNRAHLWSLTERMTERVLAAGGRFYFAKDSVLRPMDVERAYGQEKISQFLALKQRLDPNRVLSSDLFRRTILP